jgi:hypothetical protein
MAKKVNGYMINHGGWIEFDQAPDDNGPWVPCTMVISDKAHERVFTESEVKAMLKDAEQWVENMTDGRLLLSFDSIAAKHGLSDPA